MLKNVKITEKRSNVVIAKYPIMFGNPHFTEREFFDEAWVSSIEDGLVSPDNKKKHKIEIADETFQKDYLSIDYQPAPAVLSFLFVIRKCTTKSVSKLKKYIKYLRKDSS